MPNHELIEDYCAQFNHQVNFSIHGIDLKSNQLKEVLLTLKDKFNFIMLLDICAVDLKELASGGDRYEVNYHLLNLDSFERIRVKVKTNGREVLPSVTDIWSCAGWYQNEVWDMMGIEFLHWPKKRILNHGQFVGHPLRKDYSRTENQKLSSIQVPVQNIELTRLGEEVDEGRWVNLSSPHPMVRGTYSISLRMLGNTIQECEVDIGYLHRCFEKLCESSIYNHIIPLADRLNYCSPALNSVGWCHSVEKLLGIEITERAQALRMILGELSRIGDHLMCVAYFAHDLGHFDTFQSCIDQKEIVSELFEKYGGTRAGTGACRVGGMPYDIPLGWVTFCLEVLKRIERSLDLMHERLTQSRIWKERTSGSAVSSSEAISWGYTGPCLRACGVNYDIRAAEPYYFYGDIDFEVPLGARGNNYDRYLVRVEEIRQSIKIITQVLDNVPAGDIWAKVPDIIPPDKTDTYTKLDSREQHTQMFKDTYAAPPGEIYSFTEAANGELGFYIVSTGDTSPYRVKVRAPSFPIFQSFGPIVKGQEFGQAQALLAGLNVVAGEMDR